MKRRESLKILTLGLGGIIATPTLLQLLSACETPKGEKWVPKFLTSEEKFITTHLTDLILPASETIGALDVQVPQFIDLVLHKVAAKKDQEKFKKGTLFFKNAFKKIFAKEISEGTKNDFLIMLNTYFNISSEKQTQIFKLLESDQVSSDNEERYYIYSYLMFIRSYTLFGYFTSEKVGTGILTYDPTPGFYNGCVPIEEAGNIPST
jgi:hypothetical protein